MFVFFNGRHILTRGPLNNLELVIWIISTTPRSTKMLTCQLNDYTCYNMLCCLNHFECMCKKKKKAFITEDSPMMYSKEKLTLKETDIRSMIPVMDAIRTTF